MCIANQSGTRGLHTSHLSLIISNFLYQLSLRGFLAEREIIANANFYHNVNSESARVRNPSAKVQRISEIHSTFAEKVKKTKSMPTCVSQYCYYKLAVAVAIFAAIINRRRGWKDPMQIRDEHIRLITSDCMDVLRRRRRPRLSPCLCLRRTRTTRNIQ